MPGKRFVTSTFAALLCFASVGATAATFSYFSSTSDRSVSHFIGDATVTLVGVAPEGDVYVGGHGNVSASGTISIGRYGEWSYPSRAPGSSMVIVDLADLPRAVWSDISVIPPVGTVVLTNLRQSAGSDLSVITPQEVSLPSSLSLVLATAAVGLAGGRLRRKTARAAASLP